jgi:hypothetical protein
MLNKGRSLYRFPLKSSHTTRSGWQVSKELILIAVKSRTKNNMRFLLVDLLQDGKLNPKRVVKPGMDLVNIKLTLDNMTTMLQAVVDYVDRVMVSRPFEIYFQQKYVNNFLTLQNGSVAQDSNMGRNLMQIIDSVPLIDSDLFDTLMTNNMNVRALLTVAILVKKKFPFNRTFKDLLMVSYLSNLIKLQITLNEKLSSI